MGFIVGIVGTMLVLDILWCVSSVRCLASKPVRLAAGFFSAAQLCGLLWLLIQRWSHPGSPELLPKFGYSLLFIWHMIVLPLVLVAGVVLLPVLAIAAAVRLTHRTGAKRDLVRRRANGSGGLTRRQFLGFTCAVAPPLLNISLATIAMRQLQQFRVRRFVVPLADLPRELHGLSIAQVSDMHVGRFTSGRVLREIVHAVNDLRADLVLLTGDLINDALADLAHGFDLVRAMKGRFGLYLIEGNHDLIENPSEFERRTKDSGIPFLLDQSQIVTIRGVPLQLLGLSWTRAHQDRDLAIAAAVRRLASQRAPDVFPILLAHHPHAFDAAAELGIPLTLSGHTHGGQLMLNEQVGFGPALFRYWSGLYHRGDSKLIVSNGVGNWFPLRVRAPAELVHITLVRS